MFSTLKRNDDSLVVLPTSAPFTRARSGKNGRMACVACRSNKTRCSNEIEGCERCRNRNIECVYLDNNEAAAFMSAGNTGGQANSKQRTRSDDSISRMSRGSTRHTPSTDQAHDLELHRYDSSLLGLGSRESNLDESQFPTDGFDFLDSDFWNGFAVAPFDQRCTPAGHESHDMSTSYFDSMEDCQSQRTLYDLDLGRLSTRTNSTVTSCTTNSPQDPQTRAVQTDLNVLCVCPVTAVGIWRGYIQRQRSSLQDTRLQHFKVALEECGILAGCSHCSSDPETMLLLIGICEKILESLKGRKPRTSSDITAPSYNDAEYTGLQDAHTVLNIWLECALQLGKLVACLSAMLRLKDWPTQKSLIKDLQEHFTHVI